MANHKRGVIPGYKSLLVSFMSLFVAMAALADETDPHAHHKQMMNKTSYGRSVHTYELGEIGVTRSDGTDSTLADVVADDRPVMVHFIFTTCTTICPVQAATFSQVQHHLGDEASEIQMISISIDPEYDTPTRLREYAKKFHAGSQWDFLTGTGEQMIRVQRAFDAYEGGKMNHKPLTLLKPAGSNEWVRLDGLVNSSDIITEYRKLSSTS